MDLASVSPGPYRRETELRFVELLTRVGASAPDPGHRDAHVRDFPARLGLQPHAARCPPRHRLLRDASENRLPHIGLAKTGTTSLQLALQENATGLAERGILFPGGTHGAQTIAVFDLMGRTMPGEDYPRVPGAFDRLTEEIDAWPGSVAVLSHELLALARPGHVKRLVASLPAHRIAVVVTVRDLASSISSSYQQEVFQGSTVTWSNYLRALRTQRKSAAVSFWMRQDLLRVLGVWERFVARGTSASSRCLGLGNRFTSCTTGSPSCSASLPAASCPADTSETRHWARPSSRCCGA
jgi:hypothetical protein